MPADLSGGTLLYPPGNLPAVLCWHVVLSRSLLVRMNAAPGQSLLEELDARQEELLEALEQLNRRIEQVLQECVVWRGPLAGQPDRAIA